MGKRPSKNKIKYLNFPIQMLSGFLIDHTSVLSNIALYAIYQHSLTLKHGEYDDKFLASANYFGLMYTNRWKAGNEAVKFFEDFTEKYGTKNPMVGINLQIFNQYLNDEEPSEFSKACLLGFLALKSVLQNKSYCKMTNLFWLSRMDGRAKSVTNQSELSPLIRKYHNEYQTKKIKNELQDNWNLVHYARYTRGFYVSFKLNKEELIYQAELRRKSTKEKQRRFEEKVILDRVMDRINNPDL
ncbi:hypothetical protein [Sediminibacter sp. Hel_I_10]|uniref:hypothetical protein n=1 Tax=Sediminibacter sp. Hel_I_10 TaxID=1392490 RepID=UPI0004798708|nr:hypothetical protein [Sediminibacter sp. Hel_I_10]